MDVARCKGRVHLSVKSRGGGTDGAPGDDVGPVPPAFSGLGTVEFDHKEGCAVAEFGAGFRVEEFEVAARVSEHC